MSTREAATAATSAASGAGSSDTVPSGTVERSYLDAVRGALAHAMREDERVVVLGEDVAGGAGQGAPLEGSMGGTFGATKGLLEEFGPRRVRDTPISEAAFVGAAVGAAMAGLRPVVDVMWASFTPYAWDQIVNQAAKLRYMSGGQAAIPLVLRMAVGAGLRAAAQHSDTFYPLFTHVPGLKVAVPATPAEAQGLLLSAIADDNPVIVLEHMALYTSVGPVADPPVAMSLGVADVVRPGRDVTLACVGQTLVGALEVAGRLSAEGIDVEVLSLRTLAPLDLDTVLASVARTGRLVVAEEAPPRCSVAADLAATVGEHRFGRLAAPIARVNTAACPAPFSPPLEDAYLPNATRIEAAVRRVVGS
jgi:pyruvate dehydrogenase E1 component beta subunit